jgi:hypothetical protein
MASLPCFGGTFNGPGTPSIIAYSSAWHTLGGGKASRKQHGSVITKMIEGHRYQKA